MSSKCKQQEAVSVSLLVDRQALPQFTTLLQAGIHLNANQGETIGGLLAALPGFEEEYVRQRVQTIFLNGLPADDLGQQLRGSEAVIAITTAMPGLAGAIFRKGGAHAALRTTGNKKEAGSTVPGEDIAVRLKLFTLLAKERGEAILAAGCCIKAAGFEKFMTYRAPLMAAIKEIKLDDRPVDIGALQDFFKGSHSATPDFLHLTIKGGHGD
ncbi:MAG: hypothetical protein ABFR63_06225 [Thermodesulfobacteriota bacterium]